MRFEATIRFSPKNRPDLAIAIDAKDLPLVLNHVWVAVQRAGTLKVYACTTVKGVTILLHRVVMDASPETEVTHLNGNGLDCRRENLQVMSHADIMATAAAARTHQKGVRIKVVRYRSAGGKVKLYHYDRVTKMRIVVEPD